MSDTTIITARDLSIEYRIGKVWLNALCDINLSIRENEIHGLVGESGSGKSTLGLGMMCYLTDNARISAGEIYFDGQDLAQLGDGELQKIWGNQMSFVPQNPLDSLNPTLTIGKQMMELTEWHLGLSKQEAKARAIEALMQVKIADPELIIGQYPHQLSGGMQQRVMIALALSTRPRLLVLDEPTTALDVTTQAVILDLVRELIKKHRGGALYVSHDLGTIAQLCDSVTVLYAGEVMESASVYDVFDKPLHPYTIGLLGSIPSANDVSESRLATIGGVAPSLAERSQACVFADRCPIAIDKCHKEKPLLERLDSGRSVRCWRWRDISDGSVEVTYRQQIEVAPAPQKADLVLEVRGIHKRFSESGLWARLFGQTSAVEAVRDVSFRVRGRSTVGVVGESGSGKTTLARAIVALNTADEGTIELLDIPLSVNLHQRDKNTLRNLRMIFQNPNDALNPYKTVGEVIGRTFKVLSAEKLTAGEIRARVLALLEAVGLTGEYYSRTPSQLSGGEKQRIAIARAFAASPALIIADEPTSALDVSVQAVILNLLKDLRAREGASYVIISHDLEVISYVADWIVVMYLGEVVEQGTMEDVYNVPSHPYTEALLSAIPHPNPRQRQGHIRLEGDVPSPRHKPSGCPFHTRCPRYIGDICKTDIPPVRVTGDGHQIRCHHDLETLIALQTSAEDV